MVHPDSESKMLGTVIRSTVISLSYRSLTTRMSMSAVQICMPLLPLGPNSSWDSRRAFHTSLVSVTSTLCALATVPFLRKYHSTVSIHPLVLKALKFSVLFRRLKNTVCLPSWDWHYSN